jgi:hypothetical protein
LPNFIAGRRAPFVGTALPKVKRGFGRSFADDTLDKRQITNSRLVTMVRTKPGMSDDYLKSLAQTVKLTSDEAKKQGVIMDYKILIDDASDPHDYNILIMQEVKNFAAYDGIREKLDPIAEKLIGNQDQQRQLVIKRIEVREILGTKRMREITLK